MPTQSCDKEDIRTSTFPYTKNNFPLGSTFSITSISVTDFYKFVGQPFINQFACNLILKHLRILKYKLLRNIKKVIKLTIKLRLFRRLMLNLRENKKGVKDNISFCLSRRYQHHQKKIKKLNFMLANVQLLMLSVVWTPLLS